MIDDRSIFSSPELLVAFGLTYFTVGITAADVVAAEENPFDDADRDGDAASVPLLALIARRALSKS